VFRASCPLSTEPLPDLTSHAIQLVGDTRVKLGESPVWDAKGQVLFWIDIIGRRVYRRDIATGFERSWETPQEVGCIALATDDNLVMGLEDGFYTLDLASGTVKLVAPVEHPGPRMRINDGKTDRQGRFVAGSLVQGRKDRDGRLYRLDPAGVACELQRDIACTNGVCFSPDGATLYYTDTYQQAIYAADYDRATGTAGERRVLVDTTPYKGRPDGGTVDAEGYLWWSLVDTGQLARFSPDGKLDRMIDLGVPFCCCPTFGGSNMDRLFITSIQVTHTMRNEHPLGGRLFVVDGLGVAGIPETRVRLH
jgi:L-arabinonolactonase